MTQLSARPVLGIVTLLPLFLAAGCVPQPPASTDARGARSASVDLAGTSWRLVDIAGTPARPGVEATLEFPEAGRAGGKASCNHFFGTVEISGQSIRFGPLAATKMACVNDATNAQELRYLEALQRAERLALDGPALLIYSKGTERPLRFERK